MAVGHHGLILANEIPAVNQPSGLWRSSFLIIKIKTGSLIIAARPFRCHALLPWASVAILHRV
jgi:hypothetical protein